MSTKSELFIAFAALAVVALAGVGAGCGPSSGSGSPKESETDASGATDVFDPGPDGQRISIRAEGSRFVNDETGSVWNILGEAIEGPLAGKAMTPVVHGNHFWFVMAAFNPDTLIYRGMP